MNSFLRVFGYILLLGLFGCVSQNALKGSELAQCKMTCAKHFEFCTQNCINNCPTCSRLSKYNSATNFSKYVNERKVQGKKIMRELNSYRDPLQCRKVKCDCKADLTVCQQSCSGVIPKRLRAVPNCV